MFFLLFENRGASARSAGARQSRLSWQHRAGPHAEAGMYFCILCVHKASVVSFWWIHSEGSVGIESGALTPGVRGHFFVRVFHFLDPGAF